MNRISLETSQHVLINYEPADIFERILAWFIDIMMLIAYSFIINFIWDGVTADDFTWQGDYGWIQFLIITLPVFLYHLIIETLWKGYSLGKKIMKIRVVKIDGSRPGLGSYIVRWLFRIFEITLMGGVFALITILINGKGQRLGDIVAKTSVVRDRSKTKLSDTIFADIDTDYTPHFSGALDLTDKDINIIKEVLGSRNTYDYNTWFVMVTKTRKAIEEKTGIINPDMKGDEYLEAVIEDYNHQHATQPA